MRPLTRRLLTAVALTASLGALTACGPKGTKVTPTT
jgi:predicted small lipoprotein YifL